MASGKEIAGGILGLIVIGGLVQSDEHAPPPPPICQVPQTDGSTISVEITSVPCDQIVQRALNDIQIASELKSKLPEYVTIEVTVPAPDTPPTPAIQATPDQLKDIGQPLKGGPDEEAADPAEPAASETTA